MAERGVPSRRQLRSACGLLLLAIFGAVSAYGQTPQEKAAAFAAIKAKWESLPGLDSSADNAELLAFLRTRPEFSDSGIVDGSSCVWAKFNDGRLLILANNFELSPPAPAAPSETAVPLQSSRQPSSPELSLSPGLSEFVPPLATGEELPASRRARLIHTIRGWPTAVPDIRPWLVAAGYDVVDDPGTLATLRAQSDPPLDGVLYMEAHGGPAPSTVRPAVTRFALYTSDDADVLHEASDPVLSQDLDLERVVYFAGKEVVNPVTRETAVQYHYAITDAFVDKYWKFARNSLVFLTVCGADATGWAQSFKTAIFAANAGVYAAWSQNVHAGPALNAVRLSFDRFLGANDPDAFPEFLYKQRPFFWQPVGGDPLQSDLAKHNQGIDTSTGAVLSFTPNSIAGFGDFGLLAPSIIFMQAVDVSAGGGFPPAGTLTIVGTFGSDPRPDPDSKVTVGGIECPVQFAGWDPAVISCDIPPGASGDVVVTVRKHESNKARLTKWTGTFRYSVRGSDTLQVDIVYHVAFRVDVRKVRLVIHDLPVDPVFGLSNLGLIPDESSASYLCSGRSVTTELDTTRTITWTGGGNMPATRVAPESADAFNLSLNGLPGPNVNAQFNHGANPGCNWTDVTVSPTGTITATGRSNLDIVMFDIGTLAIEPNDPSFPADFRNLTRLGCGNGLPSSTVLQCRIEWDPILATSPPDPDSAR